MIDNYNFSFYNRYAMIANCALLRRTFRRIKKTKVGFFIYGYAKDVQSKGL